MKYTVQKLATLAGISVRTLHYYDEIGLLKPTTILENGYRVYAKKEMLRLQQILFYRELEFPLEEIKKILEAPNFKMIDALRDHKKLLSLKKERLEELLKTIDNTLEDFKGGDLMGNDDLYGGFSKKQMEAYKEEARQRWGHTDAYKQSVSRTKNWTKQDYQKIADEHKDIAQKLASLMDHKVSDPDVQAQIERHYTYVSTFYDCPYEMYRNLGIMYVEDKRFTKTYDALKPGLAPFLRDAIAYYCDQKEGK